MKVMSQNAGITDVPLTNHSARKRLVQKLRNSGVEAHDFMQISGHKSVESINNYSEIADKKHKECSNILNSTEDSHDSSALSVSDGAPLVSNEMPLCQNQNSEGSSRNVLSNITTMTNSAQNNALFLGATLNIQNFHLHINKQ